MSDQPQDRVIQVVKVVKGSPTPEELAAVLAVLGAPSSTDPSTDPTTDPSPAEPTGWSAYWRSVRAPLIPGPGAWRSSGRLG